METTTQNTEIELSEGLLKALALKQHLGDDYFILNGKAYEGTEDEAKNEFNSSREDELMCFTPEEFSTWCEDNLTEVDEYEENNGNYLVLTDNEADEKAAEYIKDSLWAFKASFLAGETGIDEEVFKAIQDNGKCEGNNNAIESCIDDIDSFVDAAISADGRGHFLAGYDFEENEETVNVYGEGDAANATFYIYRVN